MPKGTPQALAACGAVLCAACGALGPTSAPDIRYALERAMTGASTNALVLEYPEDTGYRFRLGGGAGVTSDTPFDVVHAMQQRVVFAYADEGRYSVDLEVFQSDGTPYLADTLSWSYSLVVPRAPIVSFTERATSDAAITMQIAGTREPDVTEIWVEGDLGGSHANGGFWDFLSDSGLYLLQVTPEDGVKTMTVKLRNVYGNESAPVEASILKKSTPPTDCAVEAPGPGSASLTVPLRLTATNDGPLYYAIVGDVDEVRAAAPFESGDTVEAKLGGGEGTKQISVVISDIAGNSCDPIPLTIEVAVGYDTQSVRVENAPYWTDDTAVRLLLRYDHFEAEGPIEAHVSGHVTGPNANAWIPLTSPLPMTLTPDSDSKRISVRFRNGAGEESRLSTTYVYLSPELRLVDAVLPDKTLHVPRIRGATNVTITGCTAAYDAVAVQTTYPCRPAGSGDVTVTYTFPDADPLSLSVTP